MTCCTLCRWKRWIGKWYAQSRRDGWHEGMARGRECLAAHGRRIVGVAVAPSGARQMMKYNAQTDRQTDEPTTQRRTLRQPPQRMEHKGLLNWWLASLISSAFVGVFYLLPHLLSGLADRRLAMAGSISESIVCLPACLCACLLTNLPVRLRPRQCSGCGWVGMGASFRYWTGLELYLNQDENRNGSSMEKMGGQMQTWMGVHVRTGRMGRQACRQAGRQVGRPADNGKLDRSTDRQTSVPHRVPSGARARVYYI